MDATKPWYRSRGVWGGALAAVAGAVQLGEALSSDVCRRCLEGVGLPAWVPALVAAAGGLVAVLGRVWARARVR